MACKCFPFYVTYPYFIENFQFVSVGNAKRVLFWDHQERDGNDFKNIDLINSKHINLGVNYERFPFFYVGNADKSRLSA